MSISVSNLAPFASYIAAHATSTPNLKQLNRALKGLFPNGAGRFQIAALATPTYPGLNAAYVLHVKEKRPVTWGGSNQIEDRLNHVIAYFAVGDFVLIYVSDSELKLAVHDALFSNGLPGWEPVDERVLVHAFVTGETLRTLWLGGAHRAVSIRPRSKILSGSDLADAIDPFGDSTFVAGAVRSSKAGVSLKRSGIWFGPKRDWNSMCATALTVLGDLQTNQANIATLSASVHSGLAESITSFTGVGPAYEVEWADPETLSGKTRARTLIRLRQHYDLSIGSASVALKDISIDVTDLVSNTKASFVLQPDFVGTRLVLNVVGVIPSAFQEFVEAVTADPELIRAYYESWHTLANSTLTLAKVQDRSFSLEFLNFAPSIVYRVDQEKPPGKKVVLANMFTAGDVSLFKWVFKEGLSQMKLPLPQPGVCWLYCDDGSGEVADFIHLKLPTGSSGKPKITLIHVKGANGNSANRRISVGAYEVVTAQAMKNLRRMISSEMHPAISNTVAMHGAARVWDQPWQIGLTSTASTGNAMLAALNSIKAQCEYEVIIVQPHVLKSKYITAVGPSTDTAAIQLRSLLFGAQAMTQAAGAKFRVICDKR